MRGHAGLMNEPHGKTRFAKIAPASARGLVERTRTLASAGNQDRQLRFAQFRGDLEEFGPHRQARDLRFSRRKEALSFGKAEQCTIHKSADLAIGEPRHRVWLHDY